MKQITLRREALHTGTLILVNGRHSMAWDAPKDLVCVADGIQLERQAARLLRELIQELDGQRLIALVSGWRSMAEQQAIWNSCLKENGPEYTRTYVAVPGHSEHQTGLAIDLGLRQEHIDFICPEFPDVGVCGQFKRQAASHGFILRYPAGKEAVTGIGCEPWHFRYVGVPHARIMEENNQTLEEYTEYIKQFDSRLHPYCIRIGGRAIYISYIPANSEQTVIEVNEAAPYQISGNNVDGFVLTQWAPYSSGLL
ncbi:MAG: M15 family metallopeptidase [bacterium]|nr:M15 family metallopeptidase [bacterium]MCM1375324.1 M15 family metallopeptidase [Muribaculum sp.]MCM1409759.1 M15 family metallopeptidase [Lachnospiraceae bacterium]